MIECAASPAFAVVATVLQPVRILLISQSYPDEGNKMNTSHIRLSLIGITAFSTACVVHAQSLKQHNPANASSDRGVSQIVERPSTSGSGTVKTATSGAPGVNNLPGAESSSGTSALDNPNPPVMPSNSSGGPGLVGAPHVGIPGTGRTDDDGKGSKWAEKVIQK